jgi:EthD domain
MRFMLACGFAAVVASMVSSPVVAQKKATDTAASDVAATHEVAPRTFKLMIFARKKAGLSDDEFVRLYEGTHLKMAKRLVAKGVLAPTLDYRRSYLIKQDPLNINPNVDFDVVTEAWYSSREAFEAKGPMKVPPEVAKEIQENMGSFLDLASMHYVVVDERRGYEDRARHHD